MLMIFIVLIGYWGGRGLGITTRLFRLALRRYARRARCAISVGVSSPPTGVPKVLFTLDSSDLFSIRRLRAFCACVCVCIFLCIWVW